MKRTISLLMVCALLLSCAKETVLPEQPVQEDGTYTLTVSAGRKNGAWYHTEARVEPCTHPGYNASNCPYHIHP